MSNLTRSVVALKKIYKSHLVLLSSTRESLLKFMIRNPSSRLTRLLSFLRRNVQNEFIRNPTRFRQI